MKWFRGQGKRKRRASADPVPREFVSKHKTHSYRLRDKLHMSKILETANFLGYFNDLLQADDVKIRATIWKFSSASAQRNNDHKGTIWASLDSPLSRNHPSSCNQELEAKQLWSKSKQSLRERSLKS